MLFVTLYLLAVDSAVHMHELYIDLQVNLIENKHRFILVIENTEPKDIIPVQESIRLSLQTAIGQIVLIENVQTRLVVNNGILDFDESGYVFPTVNAKYITS